MSNREALRELQGRLASRMQAARTEARVQSWLAVECAGQGVLFPLQEAGEIFSVGSVLPVPHTQPWFAGVANLRGGLHAVVDLAQFLGLQRGPAAVAGDGARDGARLLALNPSLGVNCALLVDRLAGLRNADQLTAEPDDAAGPAGLPAFAGPRWRDADGRVWQEIELAALAGHEQFLGVAG
ncbi:MAG: chemotaxis protein CheW [Burkholderiaceae bacterium]|jgi:twitching motility protein PilI|nr:chemotaxis protein CheW [Burkholderiaceae bacterium]